MELFFAGGISSFPPISIAAVATAAATAACVLCALLWFFRSSAARVFGRSSSRAGIGSKKACTCGAVVANGTAGDRYEKGMPVAGVERQTGGSMMEQLVPEITTHALSYLDYRSLCRLSMTNSWMQRAANDDNAWKALYHKDFTVEQDSVVPHNGWKAYYAATKAIVSVNADFYNIIKEQSLLQMGRLWLNSDYVKCIHGNGELFTGYSAVMESWELVFNWGHDIIFQINDVRARVLSDMAWVTMKAYVTNVESGLYHITNVYEFHNGQWQMVHHHSSRMPPDEEGEA